tara:strand:- start:535 stop:744 length:210 start_codon:yes stop_codon:yes gene_type:complete
VEALSDMGGVFVGNAARRRGNAEDGDVVMLLDTQGAGAFVPHFRVGVEFGVVPEEVFAFGTAEVDAVAP